MFGEGEGKLLRKFPLPLSKCHSSSIPKNAVAFSCASRGSSGSHAGRRKAWKSGSETRP